MSAATSYFRPDLIRRLEQSSEAVHHQLAIEKKLNPNPEFDPTQAYTANRLALLRPVLDRCFAPQ